MADPEPLTVVNELRDYLIAKGVGVDFYDDAPSPTLPGIARDPRDGAPLPRDGEPATLTLVPIGQPRQSPMESWLESNAVAFIVRARHATVGQMIQRGLRRLFVPIDAPGGKRWGPDELMGRLRIECSFQFAGESRIPPATEVSRQANIVTYDTTQTIMFECRRKSLDGLPYAP